MAVEEHLAVALRLVEASRDAVGRVPARPGVETAEILHRLGAAANELAHLQAGIPRDLHFQTLYPAALPENPDHISEFLATRNPAAMQQEDADADVVGSCGTGEATPRDRAVRIGRLRDGFALAAAQALERMKLVSAAAREALSRSASHSNDGLAPSRTS